MHTEFTGDYEARLYSLKELAAHYGIDKRTLVRRLKPYEKEIGKREGYYYTTLQVSIIFSILGPPKSNGHLSQ